MMRTNISLLFLIAVVMLSSCGNGNNGKTNGTHEDTTSKVKVNVPLFNEDSAYFFVKAQVDMGPRVPNSEAHKKCGLWLEEKLNSYGAEVALQEVRLRAFDGTVLHAKNIIGSYNPEAEIRVMLCSHWDSRPWSDNDPDSTNWKKPVDGANDGASGVGILLELARIFQTQKPGIGIDIIFFDAEDYGEPIWDKTQYQGDYWGLGSQYWAKNPHKKGYSARYGILLDMVGVPSAVFAKEGFSMQYAPDIVSKVWSAAYRSGYGDYFVSAQGGMINDDHLYVNKYAGIPTINIIHHESGSQTGFFRYWHTTQDNMESIDRRTLKAVGHTILVVLYEEAPLS